MVAQTTVGVRGHAQVASRQTGWIVLSVIVSALAAGCQTPAAEHVASPGLGGAAVATRTSSTQLIQTLPPHEQQRAQFLLNQQNEEMRKPGAKKL